jgi:hypothetical protein
MSAARIRMLAMLQWVGLLVGAAVWGGQHVVGFGVTQAECGAGGARWGIGNDVWQATLMGVTALFIVAAEAAAVAVYRNTQETSYDTDDPPPGRIRFFAIASMAANVIFLMIVLLDGFAAIFNVTCRQG